jgi:anti-sigma factor RsiW
MSEDNSAETMGACPGEDALFAFLDGEMGAAQQILILRHLSTCEACRQSVMELSESVSQISKTLSDLGLSEAPPDPEMDSMEARILDELKASGQIWSRSVRFDAGALALRATKSTAGVTRAAVASLISGAKVAYSGALAVSWVMGPAIKAAWWVADHSPWRLAW